MKAAGNGQSVATYRLDAFTGEKFHPAACHAGGEVRNDQ